MIIYDNVICYTLFKKRKQLEIIEPQAFWSSAKSRCGSCNMLQHSGKCYLPIWDEKSYDNHSMIVVIATFCWSAWPLWISLDTLATDLRFWVVLLVTTWSTPDQPGKKTSQSQDLWEFLMLSLIWKLQPFWRGPCPIQFASLFWGSNAYSRYVLGKRAYSLGEEKAIWIWMHNII